MAEADMMVRVGGDTLGLQRELDKASGRLDKFGRQAGNIAKKVVQIGTASAAAGTAIAVSLVERTASAATEIQNLSNVSGTAVERFQQLAFGAKSVQIEQDKLARIFMDTSDKVGDFLANGAGPMADFFKNIAPLVGVTADQFKSLSGPDALQLYVDSLEKANVSQNEMTFYMEAVASDATALLPLLRDGGKGFEDMANKADKLGVVMSELDMQALREGKTAFNEMGAAIIGARNALAVEMVPWVGRLKQSILDASESATDLIRKIGDIVDEKSKEASIEREINALIGEQVDRRGRVTAIASKEAKQMNQLLREQADLMDKINTSQTPGGGRSAAADRKKAAEQKEHWESEHEANAKIIEQLKQKSSEAEKVYNLRKGIVEETQKAVNIEIDGGKAINYVAPSSGEEDEGKTDKERDRLEKLAERFQTEREMLTEHEVLKVDIKKAHEAGFIETKEAMNEKLLIAEESFQNRLTDLIKSGNASRESFEKLSMKNKAKTIFGHLDQITAGVSQHNKTMFRINQVAGIANAIINAYEGISTTLKAYPFPINVGMAAAHATAAFAQVNAIRSASYSGGGGTAPSLSGSTSAPAVSDVGGGSNSGGDQGGSRGQSLTIEGISPDSLFTGEQVRSLAEELEKHQRNGGTVFFA